MALVSPTQPPSPTPTEPLVAAAPPSFHAGEVGIAYAPVVLAATGGRTPYLWTVSSGALPGGLNLGGDGSISGTPNTTGTFTFTVRVADHRDSAATIDGKISIAAPLAAGLIPACRQYCNVELGCQNPCGNFGSLSGGVGPYTYSLSQGTLPSGTSLSGLSLAGTFAGQPGWLQFTVQVSDSLGATASIAPKFWLYPHISLASGTCYGNYNTGCSARLAISGGVPGSAVSVKLVAESQNATANPSPNQGRCWTPANTAPPSGYGLSVSGGYMNVSIPKGILNGYGAIWTVVVISQDVCGAGVYCTSPNASVTIGVQCG